MIFLLLWLRLLCFFPDNQRMFWQLTLRSVLCGAANSLTSTTKPFHGGVLKIEDNDQLPLTGGGIRMFFYTSHYPFLNIIWPQNQLFSGPWTSLFSRLKEYDFGKLRFFAQVGKCTILTLIQIMWTFVTLIYMIGTLAKNTTD